MPRYPDATTYRLAPYACRPAESRGRLWPEAESPTRSCFQRDRDRVIHCGAFRRLMHKTQVFVYHVGDYYRTRLTHSIEVAQIARSASRALGLNEDLAEALALAHDLGHTPFGHAGEEALNQVMAPFGGFDHNEQTFRVLTMLERRYAEFDGLNLTWETLEGLVKHNGPLSSPDPSPAGSDSKAGREGETRRGVPPTVTAFCATMDLEPASHPGAEAQVAALSDDIAYSNHDIDDGLRAGLFTVEDLDPVPLVGPVFREVAAAHPGLDRTRLNHEAARRLIDRMVGDLLAETGRRLAEAAPKTVQDIRDLGTPVVAFSEDMAEVLGALKGFLFSRMYRHERVVPMIAEAGEIVRDLFAHYLERPERLPEEWRSDARDKGTADTARLVADYIAGMTDRFALQEHRARFGRESMKNLGFG